MVGLVFVVVPEGNVVLDFPGETDEPQGLDDVPGDVEFPPFVPVGGKPLMGVVVVVPAFSVAEEGDPPVVLRFVGRLVVRVAPHVRGGVHEPRAVVSPNHAGTQAPENHRQPQATEGVFAHGIEDDAEDDGVEGKRFVEESLDGVAVKVGGPALEEGVALLFGFGGVEPEHMSPPEAMERAVGVFVLVGVDVVLAMGGHPFQRAAFGEEWVATHSSGLPSAESMPQIEKK